MEHFFFQLMWLVAVLTVSTICVVFVLRKSCAASTLPSTSPTVPWKSQRGEKWATEARRGEWSSLSVASRCWSGYSRWHSGKRAEGPGRSSWCFPEGKAMDMCLNSDKWHKNWNEEMTEEIRGKLSHQLWGDNCFYVWLDLPQVHGLGSERRLNSIVVLETSERLVNR